MATDVDIGYGEQFCVATTVTETTHYKIWNIPMLQ